MKKIIVFSLLSILNINSYSQNETILDYKYDFLDKNMQVVQLKDPKKISKTESERIYNYREYYMKNNKIVSEIKNFYAAGKYPLLNNETGFYDKFGSILEFSNPRNRKGKIRSTYSTCVHNDDIDCVNGILTKYHPNGELEHKTEYLENRIIDTTITTFFPNGKIYSLAIGSADNSEVEYHDYSGECISKYNFIGGELNGKFSINCINGELRTGNYIDGILDGEVLDYKDGVLVARYIFNKGKQISIKKYSRTGSELFDFTQEVNIERAKDYYNSNQQLSNNEGLYKVNGSQIYNQGGSNSWSPNWDLALISDYEGIIYGYQTGCYCLTTSKVENGSVRLKLDPTTVENFYNLTWISDDGYVESDLVEVKANGGLLSFKNHTMIKVYPTGNKKISVKKPNNSDWAGNGSGIIISQSGYIITNNHVIEDADDIEVEFIIDGEVKKFNAELIQSDKLNDLAVIKIFDMNFDGLAPPPFNFKTRPSDVGTKVYAYGYPMALSVMGKEIKITDGIISSKTGYDGNITTYQITAPIQGGNSGGPLFDDKGNFIGINSSGLSKDISDNVGYTIKSSYVMSLIDVLPKSIKLPSSTKLQSLPLTEQIKEISKYVVLVKVK